MPKLQILGIPCNQFGAQEPGDEEEIKAFVAGETANSRGLQLSGGLKGASNFTLLAKSAINGNGTHPIFKLAKDKFPGETNWNFADMLIFDENGDLQTRHSAGTRSPLEGPLLEAMVAKYAPLLLPPPPRWLPAAASAVTHTAVFVSAGSKLARVV